MAQTSVLKLYHTVIDDVIAGVRDAFLDEGVDEQVLQEMKQVWTNKLLSSKAVESNPEPLEPQPPPILANSSKPVSHVKANGTKSKARNNAASNAAAVAAAMNNANSNSQNENSSNMNSSNSMLNGNKQTAQTNQIIQSNSQSIQQQQHHQQPQQQQQQQQQPQPPSQPPAAVAGLDPNKIVPIQITLPAQAGVAGSEQPRVLTIQVPASALQENQLHQVLTGPIITSIMPLPPHIASSVLQQHVNSALANQAMAAANALSLQKQLDGADDTSDEDGSDVSDDNIDGDDDDLDKADDDKETDNEGGAEEEPLNSEDDVTDEDDAPDLFDSENVVVCQYDKITRSRNKWKFYLKDGIMHINGKDYVFQKSNGDAEW